MLGHEELQAAATAYLGPARLKEYRERLHAWAEDYRRRGWPAGTPEYLLRGYFRLLHDAHDIPRLLACATDQLRHDRMLDITGGDTAALTEITDAQELLLRQEEPDLPALARLNVHRILIAHATLISRLTCQPSGRRSVTQNARRRWPRRSRPGPAGAGAGDLAGRRRRGDRDRARALAEQAEAAARAITDPGRRTRALSGLAQAAGAGDLDRAQAAARRSRSGLAGAGAVQPGGGGGGRRGPGPGSGGCLRDHRRDVVICARSG